MLWTMYVFFNKVPQSNHEFVSFSALFTGKFVTLKICEIRKWRKIFVVVFIKIFEQNIRAKYVIKVMFKLFSLLTRNILPENLLPIKHRLIVTTTKLTWFLGTHTRPFYCRHILHINIFTASECRMEYCLTLLNILSQCHTYGTVMMYPSFIKFVIKME